MQLVFEDLLEKAKEKEEKEAKKRQRVAKDFTDMLSSMKVYKISKGIFVPAQYQLFIYLLF